MNINANNFWEEIKPSDIRVDDFVYISWIAPEGNTISANPVMGEVADYKENILYLLYNGKYITVSLFQTNLYTIVMRKT